MSKNPKRIRRTFSDDFKQDAVNLVVKQGYSFAAAAKAVDVSSRSLREWHAQLAPEPEACDETSSLEELTAENKRCLLYTSPSPRDRTRSRMPSSA